MEAGTQCQYPRVTRSTDTSVELGPLDGPTRLTLSMPSEADQKAHASELLLYARVHSDGSSELDSRVLVGGGARGFDGLVDLFGEMADEWEGWDAPKEWSSAEAHMSISATTDRTGHVRLRTRLRPDPSHDDWVVEATVLLEGGSLSAVHSAVRDFIASLSY